jgi:hypothetical protein
VAGSTSFDAAGIGHRLRRADGESAGAEPAVAIEVDHRLFQCGRLATAFGGYVNVPLKIDWGKPLPRQLLWVKATVCVQDQAIDPDQRRVGCARKQSPQRAAENQPSPQSAT